MFSYPFLYRVGLTDGPFCSRNTARDATVALTHAPKFTADFLCASVKGEAIQRKTKSQECFDINSLQRHKVDLLTPLYSDVYNTWGYILLCTYALTT